MEPIICWIFICLQDDFGEQGCAFFAKGQEPIFTLYISSTQINFILHKVGVPCEPETQLMVALGGLF